MPRGDKGKRFSKDRQPAPDKRKPRGPDKVTHSARQAMIEIVEKHGDLLRACALRGLTDPRSSHAFFQTIMHYGLGKPLDMPGPLVNDPNRRRGLEIVLTRPLGTDPMAEPVYEPLEASQASKDQERTGQLARAAAALRATARPQPQRNPDQPRTVEVDGQDMEVV